MAELPTFANENPLFSSPGKVLLSQALFPVRRKSVAGSIGQVSVTFNFLFLCILVFLLLSYPPGQVEITLKPYVIPILLNHYE